MVSGLEAPVTGHVVMISSLDARVYSDEAAGSALEGWVTCLEGQVAAQRVVDR
jgi:hypothetical protein